MEVLVFGATIIDFSCYVERLPTAGETLHGRKFATGFGGKGANQCVAAARLGARTAMITKLGDDSWGPKYEEALREEGVNVDFVEECKGETTGVAQICVSDAGENMIVEVAGANNLLNGDDVIRAKELFDNSKILLCQLEIQFPATLAALRYFKGISILNAAPVLAETPKELVSAATILCVNEVEAAQISGCGDITTLDQAKGALGKLIEMGANTVIITLGPLGAVYAKREAPTYCIHVATVKVDKVVDTTGAGDAFLGSLAYYMVRYPNAPLHQLIGGACEIASYSVQSMGTQSSYPRASQMDLDLDKKSFEWKEI